MPVAALKSDQKRNVGRPRCKVAKESILAATVRLLRHTSVRELAIESIAREAHVGKATIYRWWPNKTAVVIESFFSEAAPLTSFPVSDSPSEAIEMQCKSLIEALSGPLGDVVGQVIGEGQSDIEVLNKFREIFLQQRCAEFAAIYQRGVVTGEFNGEVDPELATDIVYGPVWYRLLIKHQPLDKTFAETFPKIALAALAA